jgi:4-amino-4-deoxy-L-arabinose transferase-like glycosyltransferase
VAARSRTVLWGIVLVAVALRVPTLDLQSFWADEAATVDVVRHDLGDLYAVVRDQESTPPLYYLLARIWTVVTGTGEVGLRSLSAVIGVLTVPVVAAVGTRMRGARAGMFAALLVATNPLLIWFSQEARAYALLVLLTALSLLTLLRAVEHPSRARLLAWGAVAALLLATHYFALFPVAGEAAWLAVALRGRTRSLLTALAPVTLAGAALLPLALDQRSAARAHFIADQDLGRRVAQVPKQFLVGYDAPFETLLGVLAAVVGVAALVVLITGRHGPGAPRAQTPRGPRSGGPTVAMTVVTVAALGVPLVFAIVGEDYLVTRNVLAGLVPLLVLIATGAAAIRPPVLGAAVTAVLAASGTTAAVGVALDDGSQREDWRDAVHALGRVPAGHAVVVRPGSGRLAAELYLGKRVRSMRGPALVSGIDVIAVRDRTNDEEVAARGLLLAVPPAIPGLTGGAVRSGSGWAIQRFTLPGAVVVDPVSLVAAAPQSAVLLVNGP